MARISSISRFACLSPLRANFSVSALFRFASATRRFASASASRATRSASASSARTFSTAPGFARLTSSITNVNASEVSSPSTRNASGAPPSPASPPRGPGARLASR